MKSNCISGRAFVRGDHVLQVRSNQLIMSVCTDITAGALNAWRRTAAKSDDTSYVVNIWFGVCSANYRLIPTTQPHTASSGDLAGSRSPSEDSALKR